MNLQKLAPETHYSVESWDELVDKSNSDEFNYDYLPTELAKLSPGEKEGEISSEYGNFHLTPGALESLCKHLKMPQRFAQYIPWDLFCENLERLKEMGNRDITLVTHTNGANRLISTPGSKFVPIPHAQLINPLRSQTPIFERSTLSDRGLWLSITTGENQEVFYKEEIKPGDETRTGVEIVNSPSGYKTTQAQHMMYRLVCSNGMVMPTAMGIAKCRPKSENVADAAIKRFIEELNQLTQSGGESLVSRLKKTDRPLNVVEFDRFWKSTRRLLGIETGQLDNEIFEVPEDDRKDYVSQAKEAKQEISSGAAIEDLELTVTSCNGYKFINNLTDFSKDYDRYHQSKIEAFSGKAIVALSSN